MKESYKSQNSLELKLPSRSSPICKTKKSLTRKKKMDIKVDHAQLPASPSQSQPLADLQNSLPQPFKR